MPEPIVSQAMLNAMLWAGLDIDSDGTADAGQVRRAITIAVGSQQALYRSYGELIGAARDVAVRASLEGSREQ